MSISPIKTVYCNLFQNFLELVTIMYFYMSPGVESRKTEISGQKSSMKSIVVSILCIRELEQ